MVDPSRIRLPGPLAAHRDGLWADLRARGYTPLSSRNLLYLMAHLSRWLLEKRLRPSDLGTERLAEFFRHRRESGYANHLSHRALEPVLRYLRSSKVVPVSEGPTIGQTVLDGLLRDYEDYLVQERAFVSAAVQRYKRVARQFLSRRFGSESLEIGRLTAADVTSFVVHESRSCSVGYAKLKVTTLRSLLRYLQVRGDLICDLTAAVPAVASSRLAGLPKSLAPSDIQKLLRGCDRRSHVGRRNHSILLLLVRLGLRANELAGLKLDDVHWTQGEIVVRGKGNRKDRLPLPCDVGEALASYLRRSRPRTNSRKLFLQARAPFRDLNRRTVTTIVRAAAAHVGVPSFGAHRLRHTAATQMLRRGASLPQIAQVLRHRSLNTTAIYAKVDRDALRPLGLPWPGEKS